MTRLSRNTLKKTKQQMIITLIGIIGITFVFVVYGIPFLINASLFLTGGNKISDTTPEHATDSSFIAPPQINQAFTATSSASIMIEGTGEKHAEILLYVNGSLTDTLSTKEDGSFQFKNVSLQEGDNRIKVKAKHNKKSSDFSDELTITYIKEKPKLDISQPNDGQSFSKGDDSIAVSGETLPNMIVTVNGFRAIVDSQGKFTYMFHLQNGENKLKIIAMDAAGNTSEVERKVTYSQ